MTRRGKKIYIVNRGTHDFTDAEKYGELVFMTEGNMPRLGASKMCRCFEPFLKDSKPTDYILLTSMTIMCVLACSMFAAKHGRVNILVWVQDQDGGGHYVSRTSVFNQGGLCQIDHK